MSSSSSTANTDPKDNVNENLSVVAKFFADELDGKDILIQQLLGKIDEHGIVIQHLVDKLAGKDVVIQQLLDIKKFFADGVAVLTRDTKALKEKCNALEIDNAFLNHQLDNLTTCDVNATHFPGYVCDDPSCKSFSSK